MNRTFCSRENVRYYKKQEFRPSLHCRVNSSKYPFAHLASLRARPIASERSRGIFNVVTLCISLVKVARKVVFSFFLFSSSHDECVTYERLNMREIACRSVQVPRVRSPFQSALSYKAILENNFRFFAPLAPRSSSQLNSDFFLSTVFRFTTVICALKAIRFRDSSTH